MTSGPLDAVLVPGGGLLGNRAVPPWVEARLERAVELAGQEAAIVTLSAGTTHKPLPLDARGKPVFESVAAAAYLRRRGFPAGRIFTESASYDTIGNAYFARTVHTDPAKWTRLAVVTSEFHMPRTETIFHWIYAATPGALPYELSFVAVPDVGLEAEALAARRAKEAAALERLPALTERLRTLAAIHAWLFSEHRAYAAEGDDASAAMPEERLLQSY